jgi:uncharacterized protein
MIAVDTNLLVYAHRKDNPWHQRAAAAVRGLAEGRAQWAVPWPCVHEFLAIVTHPRIYRPPTPLLKAHEQVEIWMESPMLSLLGEPDGYWEVFAKASKSGRAQGPQLHDARVAALCLAHGVSVLWTADRDFDRYPALRTHNPLV